jgi:hypothetical protein
MKLYHGTSASIARQALVEGLLPRSESGAEGHWEDCPSNPDLVYLTAAYAPYFAMTATEGDELWGIVEVDTDLLDEYDLLPDEDYLEQASRGQDLAAVFGDGFPEGNYMTERTEWFRERLHLFAHLWRKSIEGLGNCAHDGAIPPEAITRVAVFDPQTNRSIAMMASDPMIAILNYQFCGDKYRALCAWMMGEDVDPIRFHGIPGLTSSEGLDGPWQQMIDQWAKALALRDGLSVHTP